MHALSEQLVIPEAKWKLQGSPGLDLTRITRCQVEAARYGMTYHLTLCKVEAIKVHHFIPGRHKVTDECLLRVVARIDF